MPRGLYPASKAESRVQRIVIWNCETCNNGSSDDDVHFRNVVSIAGDATAAVNELWAGPIGRSFGKGDGGRRAKDVLALMEPATHVGENRYMVYPGRDPRILGTLRKIIRGLSHYHGLRSAVADDEVLVDVLKVDFPEDLLQRLRSGHAEPDILDYRYGPIDDMPGMESAWLLRFYERTTFFGLVFADAAQRLARGASP
ncbi:hypothetical protein X740_15760 [Mesorhizobium sp. LNHC221B00]|nr:hypothetical protein X740_15760 [Mesorhizobium sp. LNHC221B00]